MSWPGRNGAHVDGALVDYVEPALVDVEQPILAGLGVMVEHCEQRVRG